MSLTEEVSRIIISAAIVLFSFILQFVFSRYFCRFLLRLSSRTASNLEDLIISAIRRPVASLILVTGVYLAVLNLPFVPADSPIISRLFRSLVIALIGWALFNLEDPTSALFRGLRSKIGLQFDEIILPFLSRTLRVVTALLVLIIIIQEWGYEVNGFIAGLGLGGLAFALAAQDTLANIFGGVVIIWDKPFSIGDWIRTPQVEGVVEDLTFRSTKIRTFAQALVTVPNSVMAKEPITNWSRMGKRQITFNLGVTYSTPREKLERCLAEIRNMLRQHPDIHKETIFVNFDHFGDNGLQIFLYFFTVTTNWGEFLRVKEDVNFRIMDILAREGVEVAYPSTSIYIEKGPEHR